MRISDLSRHRSYTRNIEDRLVNLNRIQEELGTGRSLFAPSEGVHRADQALRARDAIAANSQFLRNIDDAQGWVDSGDSKLQAVVDLIGEINTLALAADNSSQNEDDRRA